MEFEKKTLEDARRDNFIQHAISRELGNMYKRYQAAVTKQDVEEAAEAAREYRNKLLDDCDNMMVADRPNVNTEAWRAYRQLLRDISQQGGFPLDIVWPVAP